MATKADAVLSSSVPAAVAALLALALLAIVLVAWRRRGGGIGGLIAGVVAVASLWWLYSPPVIERVLEPRSAWLRTAGTGTATSPSGFSKSDSVTAEPAGAHLEAFALPGALSAADSQVIPDPRWLARNRPEITTLRVSGHGLTAPEWSLAESWDVATAVPWRIEGDPPPALPPGFAALGWLRPVALGSDLTVRGRLSACPRCAEVRLEGVGAGADPGATAATAEDGSFELRVRPRAAGRFLPELVAVDAAGVPMLRQSFDVVVAPPAPVAVLWLERSPSFESRAVRRWREGLQNSQSAAASTANRGSLVIRSVWSRGRARTSAIGGPAQSVRIDQGSLSEFDLVVADVESLRALGGAEADALERAVREGGLGLLLRLHGEDRMPASAALLAGWRVRALSDLDELLARVAWPGFEAGEPLAIAARELEIAWGMTPLVHDRAGRALAAVRAEGAGAVAVSLLEGTYRWVLAGDRDTHAQLWSRLLGAVARPRTSGWRLPAGPVLVDWPLDLELSAEGQIDDLSCREPGGATVALPFSTRPDEPARALARFWPRLAGWHLCTAIVAGEQLTTEFFAHPPEAWRVWLDGRRHDATAVAAVLTAARPAKAEGSSTEQAGSRPRVRRPVALPRWPFYAAFLLAVGYLWAAERWSGAGADGITNDEEIAR